MTIRRMLLLIAIGGLGSTVRAQDDPAPYCKVTYMESYNMFKSFQIDDDYIKEFGPEGNEYESTGQRYYVDEVLPYLGRGSTHTFKIISYSVENGEPFFFSVWIDYNHNNVFDDEEVLAYNGNTIGRALNRFYDPDDTVTFNVTIPDTALEGKTRLRLVRGQDREYIPYTSTFILPPCTADPDPESAPPWDPDMLIGYGIGYDFDITIDASSTGISGPDIDRQVKIAPNPAGNMLNINNTGNAKIFSVAVVNIGGQVLFKKRYNNTGIDISILPCGIYIANIILEDGKRYYSKFVKL